MNVFIVTLGSRGDVQPYVALGVGLKAAGHAVTVCTSESFEPFITSHGLNYGYMSDDFVRFMDSAAGREAMETTNGVIGSLQTMRKLVKEAKAINEQAMHYAWEAAQAARPDLVIVHPKALGGRHIAEKLGVPVALAVPLPLLVPTGDFPAIGMPTLPLGSAYNRLSYKLVALGYKTYDSVVNAFRQDVLGLPKTANAALSTRLADGSPMPVLHAVSPHVVPRPTDWPDNAYMTGYWFLDDAQDWTPPADLQMFLEAGAPPVYVGFGSMAGRNPKRLAEIVIAALQQAGVRGVIATGWGGLAADQLPETIFKLESAPHDWLFPRMAAVVHHGGAGTTAAGLRAGRPTVICPFIADQPYWGKRVETLGVGPRPIPQKQLTAENLAEAIRVATSDQHVQRNAEALGQKIRQEDGIATAVAIIERLGARKPVPAPAVQNV